MRHTEFWARMDHALGRDFSRHWASDHVIAELGSRSPAEALEAGFTPKEVWGAVCRRLELPASQR